MSDNISWQKKMKEGEHMTRICAVANQEQLAISADSMFTNKELNIISFRNRKLFYKNGLIIGMLGTCEVLTYKGTIYLKDCIREYLDLYTGENILDIILGIENDMRDLFSIFKLDNPTKLIFLWVDNFEFYCYALEIRYSRRNLGCDESVSVYPFGKIDLKNYSKYKFNNYMLDTGEGVDDIIVNKFYTSLPETITSNIIKEAIDVTRLTTVGGNVYTVILNKYGKGKTFINGKETFFN